MVRTDRHLEFYGDMKNMARMSDILAVYAWIDPETGYCQGECPSCIDWQDYSFIRFYICTVC